jgi:hypothetical protein
MKLLELLVPLHQVLGLLLQSLQLLLHDALIGEQQLLLDPKQV